MSAANSRLGPLSSSRSSSRVATSGREGSGARSVSEANLAMSRPPRRPNTTMSRSEFVPRRFAPCTLTQAHSPAA